MVSTRRVLKFGGAALRDGPAVERCARIVAARHETRPLVVVSAHGGVTRLLDQAVSDACSGKVEWEGLRIRHKTLLRELNLGGEFVDRYLRELRGVLGEMARVRRADRRLRDAVLSYGERISARIVAEVLRRRGLEATPLDAYDVGLVAQDGERGFPALEPPVPAVQKALSRIPGIPVVTGFVALNRGGDLTTLGPNGSDLSAVWFGEALQASEVELWKDVPGFMSADPKVVPAARPLPTIGRADAIELALHGAEVLHPGALEPALRSNLSVRIKSFDDPEAPGTRILPRTDHRGPVGLAHRAALALWSEPVELGSDLDAALIELMSCLRVANVPSHGVAASAAGLQVLLPDDPETRTTLSALASERKQVRLEHGLSSLAIVGAGVGEDPRLADLVRAEAAHRNIEVRRAPGSANTSAQVFLCADSADGELLRAVHRKLFEGQEPK